ncbi:hypothetical protein BGZ83_001850 [Gryganskiella cystojenkinii]|nr:hypothetical protein BGZ83_001850 [Gryganskiella cystojenkinii]
MASSLSAQEQSRQTTADQEQVHRFALSLYQDRDQQQLQRQDPSSSSTPGQQQPLDLNGGVPPLDAITSKFILEELTKGAATVGPEGQILMQLQPQQQHQHQQAQRQEEEEIDIFDFIHAKQEDEDETENGDSGVGMMMDGLEGPASGTMLRSPEFSSSSSPATMSSLVDPPSPSWSASSASALSPPTCSSPSPSATSSAADQDCAYNSGLNSRQHEGSPEVYIKQEPDYMDSTASMDLYGSSALLNPRPVEMNMMDLSSPPPTQDLFRMLMEELQTQATVQREKFFTATTGSGTGMDSVDFLFDRQSVIDQAPTTATAQEPLLALKAQQQGPAFSVSQSKVSDQEQPFMRSSFSGETKTESGFTAATPLSPPQQENQGLDYIVPTTASIPVAPAKMTIDTSSISTRKGKNNTKNNNRKKNSTATAALEEDEVMTSVDPEHNAPPSPSTSLSSSGSVTPELTSPALQPSLIAAVATSSTGTSQEKPPLPTKQSPVSIAPKSQHQRSSSLSPITEMSFRSVIEQHTARRRASEVAAAAKEESAVLENNGSSRKRKLSRQVDTMMETGTMPSPPAASKKGSPLPVLNIQTATTVVTKLELPPAQLDQSVLATVDIQMEPLTPTSPTPKTEAMEIDLSSSSSTTDSKVGILLNSSALPSISPPTNSNAKRPWTNEEEQLLLQLVDSNAPIKDIAETLNRSVHSVRSRRQVLTDPGFVKGNGHAQPRRSRPDPSSKLPTYSQMAFLSLARLPELEGTLNDVASMVERLFSRHLNRIPRTGHKNLQIWRAQISDALAHEKGHPRPRFESFGIKRGRQWVYRLTDFGKGVVEAMGGVEQICDDLLKNNESFLAAEAAANAAAGIDGQGNGDGTTTELGGPAAGLGHGDGYGYSYTPQASLADANKGNRSSSANGSSSAAVAGAAKKSTLTNAKKARSTKVTPTRIPASPSSLGLTDQESMEDTGPDSAIAKAMAAMAAGLARMMAAEDEKASSAFSSISMSSKPTITVTTPTSNATVQIGCEDVKTNSNNHKITAKTSKTKKAQA